VIVDNRPGANTIVGSEVLTRSAADGYTLILLPNVHSINPSLYPKLPYDPVKDFAPVSLVGTSPLLLALQSLGAGEGCTGIDCACSCAPGSARVWVVRKRLGRAYGRGVVRYAGRHQDAAYSVQGNRNDGDRRHQRADLAHVRFRTRCPAACARRSNARLGSDGERRSPAVPELPTVAEAGLPGYSIILWYGLLVPGATPPEIVARLNTEVVKVLSEAEIRARLSSQGVDAAGSTPAAFAALIASDLKKYAELIKRSGAKAE